MDNVIFERRTVSDDAALEGETDVRRSEPCLFRNNRNAATVDELTQLRMDLKEKTMRCIAAFFVMILSIEAQTPQQHQFHQLQQQKTNHHHINSGQNNNHRYQHSHQTNQHQQHNQQTNHHHQQQQQRFQTQQQNQQHRERHQTQQQQHQNQQHQLKHFLAKSQSTLDGLKKQKYQQEKFNQNVQKQLQNHQLEPKHVKNVDQLQKEAKFTSEQSRPPLPLVLSPEKIHAMDLDPAITVVEPPKDIAAAGTGHKKTSEVKKRQFSYDAAIASLFQEALKVAGTEPHSAPLNSVTASTAQFTSLPAAQPIFKFKPVVAPILGEQLLQNPRPFHLPQLSNGLKSPSISFQHQHVEEKHEEEEEEEEEEYQNYAAKYQYGYRVVDDKEGSDFGQTESRDGDTTRGHYHVRLPDGRMQRVKYWSDPSGFHAQISYDRDAVHI
ncbi:hypothetical protein LSTR_LSTR004375 [Laodelphax striatellus]|uniref:Uncharacterized protein n=1 Tax=Laodelphax striatellus TaxID=195883 RepID=A0A482X932_LAOST|nr:hypothetical protein LSTR_LSTR004375 [Laodelphax striatellus]